MQKKPKKRLRERHLSKAGICFEALEPRLLLSGSWGAVVDGPGTDAQADAYSGLILKSMVSKADAGFSGAGNAQVNLAPGSGRIDLLSRAPVLNTFGNAVSAFDASSASILSAPITDIADASSPADNQAVASDPEMHSDSVDAATRRELVFVNDDVDAYEILINGIRESDTNRIVEIVLLDADRDGIQQVSNILADRSDLSAVHVIAHGSDGQISLGGSWLNNTTLQQNSDAVAGWGQAITETGDILFYGCNIAADSDGEALLNDISDLTGADVAASDDLTGNTEQGGDWMLEYTAGKVESNFAISSVSKPTWSGVLSTYTVSSTADSGAGSLRQAIIDANGNGGADTITFNVSGTISLSSALPQITGQVDIDGTAAPGYAGTPIVLLDGSGAGLSDGLTLGAGSDGSTIHGLAINNFGDAGIKLEDSGNHTIVGNYIGTDAAGTGNQGNTTFGIEILNSSGNQIGGSTATDRNIIADNTLDGITIWGAGSTGNVIQGNYIGVDATGNTGLGNGADGIVMGGGANNNTIGGDRSAGEGNVISGQTGINADGVEIDGAGADNNKIYGNYIGTNFDGTAKIGNARHGVVIYDGVQGTRIGGTTTGQGNIISGNGEGGVVIDGNGKVTTTNNIVAGNYIGVDITGSGDLGNTSHGVEIFGSASGNLIGGESVTAGNVIAFNSQNGIGVANGTNNSIVRNSIHSNTLLGINLGSGANNDQNFPVLTSAVTNGTQITVMGTLSSIANTSFRIEIYSNSTGDPTGYGEGQTLIGILDLGTDGFGNASFSSVLPASVSAGSAISATVSRLDGGDAETDTSEFAQNITATAAVNTAPELTGAGMYLTSLSEDPVINNGDLVSAIIARGGADPITDADAGAVEGIAIFSLPNSNGTWQYDIGSGWTDVGTVSVNSSLLLRDTDSLRFVPNADWNGLEMVTFCAWDQTSGAAGSKVDTSSYGGSTAFSSGTAVASLSVSAVNDNPAVTNLIGDVLNYTQGDGAVLLEQGADALVTDVDSSNFAGGSLRVEVDSGLQPTEDVFSIRNQGPGAGQIGISGSAVSYDGAEIGTFVGGTGVTPLEVAFNGNATPVAITALVRNLTYENTNTTLPNETARSVTIDISDGDGGASQTQNLTINVTAANSTPTDILVTTTTNGGLSLNEDGGNDAYLQANASPFSGNNAVTIEVQFSSDSAAPGITTLFSYADPANQDELYFGIDATGQLLFRTSANGSAGYGSITTAPQLFDGQRHSVAVSWENSGGILMFYVDGEQLGLGRNDYQKTTTIDAGGIVVVGQHQGAPGSTFDSNDTFSGTIYSVRVFDDVRTVAEIAASYNSPLPYDEAGLLAQWTFDKLSVDGVITETVSGNNLTVHHTGEVGFTASSPELTFSVDENALDGTVVGVISGIDAEREAKIAELLAADSNLYYNAETGKFYQAVSGWHTPAEARTNAESALLNGVNGQLVIIRSAAENEFVSNLANSLGNRIWIGATDATVEGEWRWIESGSEADQFWSGLEDGNAVNGAYQSWVPGSQPNQSGGEEDWAQMDPATGLWWDNKADAVFHYVVEWKADDVLDTTDPLTYSIQSQTVAGAFALDADSGQITVADGSLLDFETNPSHSVTVRVTDVGGLTYDEAFTITLTDVIVVNIAPVAVADSFTVNEGSSTSLNLASNDTDADNGLDLTSITIVSGPANGTIDAINADGTVDYTHNGSETISDSFTYTIDDVAGLTSNTVTVSLTITPVNDAPALDLDANDSAASGLGFAATWTEGAGPVAVADVDATLSDVDSANLSSLTVTITNLFDGANEQLTADTSGTSIVASYDSATGVLTLSGTDSLTNYQQVLRTISYDNNYTHPNETARVLVFQANDGTDTSVVATTTLSIVGTREAGVTITATGPDGVGVQTTVSELRADASATYLSKAVAVDAAGNTVVVWTTDDPSADGVQSAIMARLFDANGDPAGSEFVVNATGAGAQSDANVAMDDAGNFVVVWSSWNQDGSGYGLYARRYDASGVAQGGEFLVNTSTTGNQEYASISMAVSGEFVIVWQGEGTGDLVGVYGQRYDASGVVQGGEFRINETTLGNQRYAEVAMDDSGNFIVTWSSGGQDGSGEGVYLRRYDAVGNALGGEMLVNTFTTGSQWLSSAAVNSSGQAVVAWRDDGQAGGIYMQLYNPDGTKNGGEIQIPSTPAGGANYPQAAIDDAGNVTIVWEDFVDSDDYAIVARQFDASGAPIGAQFVVNSHEQWYQEYPAIAMTGDGQFVVVFTDYDVNGSGQESVEMRRFCANTTEAGGTASFAFVLDTQPTDDVTITLSMADGTEGTLSTTTLTFTNANWNIAQTVTVTGVDDALADGNVTHLLVTSAAVSSDPNYSGLAIADVRVTNLDDDPSLDLDADDSVAVGLDFATTWTEGSGPVAIVDSDATLSDPDSANLTSLVVTITNLLDGTSELLSADTTGTSIVASYDSATGILTLTGSDLTSNYQQVLRTISYDNSSDSPTSTDRTITFVASDGTNSSPVATTTLTITPTNDAPTLSSSSPFPAILEDAFTNSGMLVSTYANLSNDVDSGALKGIAITSLDNSNGTWQFTLDGTNWSDIGSVSINNALLLPSDAVSRFRFVPNPDYAGSSGILNYKAWDQTSGNAGDYVDVSTSGGSTAFSSGTNGAAVTVTAVNDAPIVDLNGSDGAGINFSTTFTEDGGAVSVTDVDAVISDVDDTTYLSLSINLINFSDGASEQITIGSYTFTAGTSEVVVRTVGSTDFTLDFDGSGFNVMRDGGGTMPSADLETLMRGITYENVSQNPTAGDRVINFIAEDASGLLGPVATSTIAVAAVNDVPVITTVAPDVTFVEGGMPQVIDGLGTVVDVDSPNFDGGILTVSITHNASANDRLTVHNFGSGPGEVGVSGSNVTYGGTIVGSFTGGANGSDPLIITFNSNAIQVAVQEVRANIQFYNISDTPSTLTRQITFGLTDGDGGTATPQAKLVYIQAVNDPPIAVDDAVTATEDTLFTSTVDLDFNDTDLDGDSLTVVAGTFATTQGGSLVLAADGSYTYTPAANFTGIDTVDYTVTDGTLTDVGTLTITVNPVNDPPIAVDDAVTATEDTLFTSTVDLDFNDTDLDGDSLTVVAGTFATTQGGSLVLAADGSYTYTPAANFTGIDTVDYTVTDGTLTDVGTLTITVNPVNDPPIAVDDAVTATEDTLFTSTVDLDFNDTDLDGDSLTVVAGTFATTQGGSLVLAADGSYTYTPAANFTGIDTVDYTVTDGTLTDVGTLTITVNPVNDPPIAVDDAVTATEDTLFTSTVDLDFNDTDLDGDSLTVVAGTFATTQGGSLVLAADGSYTYTPAANFTGIDTVDYTVTDGTLTDVGTLTITVNPVNDPPIAVDDAVTATEDTLFTSTVDLDFNDTDLDGDSLTVVAGTFATTQGGSLVLAADGSYTYTPAANFTGIDTVDYTVTDGTLTDVGTLTITVNPVNDPPIAVDDAVTATEDTLFTSTVDLDFNDTDLDGDSLTVVAGTFATTQGGSLVLAADGSYTYTPAANFTGIDTVDYTVTDGTLTDVGTLTITVNPVNDPPIAVDDAVTATEDTLFTSTVDLDFNDTDLDGDSLTVVAGTFATTQGGSLVLAADGSYTYTPAANFTGIDTVDYTVTDGTLTDVGTLTITVNPVNDPPIAVDDAVTATEDTLFTSTVDLDFNDTDLDGDSLTVVAGTFATTQGGSLVLAADGSYTYTPAANFTGIDTVDYTVTDGTLTDVGTLTITVNPVNDPPIAVDDAVTATEDTLFTSTVDLDFNDTDLDGDSLTVVAGTFATTQGGSLVLAADGSYTYTPAANFTGIDTVDYTVTDGTLTDVGTLTITVNPVNDPPIAVDDAVTATEDTLFTSTVDLDFNDTDLDGDSLTVVAGTFATTQGGSLVLAADGSYTYTPAANFTGIDTVDYTVTDGTLTDVGTLTITVNPVNDPPIAVDDAVTATEDTLFTSTVDLDFNDTDLDGDSLTVVAGTFATTQGGSLVLAADGSYTYTPAANFTGIDTVDYTVTDGTLTDVGTLTITVNPVNDPPIAVDDAVTATEDTLFTSTVDLDFNDTDLDGDSLTVVAGTFATTQGGSLVLAADGSYTYTPAANFTGIDTVDYTVTDGTLTDVGTLTITVNPVNDPPIAVDDAVTATEDTLFTSTVDLDFNDTDLDGDSLTVVAGTFATTQGGSLVLAADGSYTYTPAANFTGIDTVDYTVTDGTLTDVGTLTITVNPVNDPPIAVDDAVTATEDTLFTSTVDLDFNDTDLDGDSLTVVAGTFATTQGGSLVLAADGSYTYTPAANFTGIDTVDYTVTDGTLTDVGTLTITVNPVNDPPVIAGVNTGAVTKNIDQDGDGLLEVGGVLTITDPDAGESSFQAGTITGAYGRLTIDAAGNWNYATDNTQAVIQQLNTGESISDVLTVTTADGTTHSITVTINGATTIVDQGGDDPGPGPDVDPIEPDPEPDPEVPPEEILPLDDELPLREELAASTISSPKLPAITPLQWADPTYFVPTISMLTTDNVLSTDDGSPSAVVSIVKYLQRELASETIERVASNVSALFSTDAMAQTMDQIQQQLGDSLEMDGKRGKLIIGAATGLGASVFAGYVIWAFRGSSLVLGALTAMPMWRCFDPLPVLMGYDKKRRHRDEAKSTGNDLDKDEIKVKELLGKERAVADTENLNERKD